MSDLGLLNQYDSQCLLNQAMAWLHDSHSPCILYKPRLFLDGDRYCFLLGEDPMNGVAGFGETAQKAAEDFNRNFWDQKAPKPFAKSDSQEGK